MMARIKEDPHELTPTESKLWEAMQDGKHHPTEELAKIIDDYAVESAVRFHMSNLRAKMLAVGNAAPMYRNGGYQRAVFA